MKTNDVNPRDLVGILVALALTGCAQNLSDDEEAVILAGSVDFPGAEVDRPADALTTTQAVPILNESLLVEDTDFVAAGVGGMRNEGIGTLELAGVSGEVTLALLVWHGPSSSNDPEVNANVQFQSEPVEGVNVGTSSSNCWGYLNSHSYYADVTTVVQAGGNGDYDLSDFGYAPAGFPGTSNTNGASLLVFFDDGDESNDRNVTVLLGNDSNYFDTLDPSGWEVSVPSIEYSSGEAQIQLHVADGQVFDDAAVLVNGQEIVAAGSVWQGNTVPSANNGPSGNGSLWDIRSFSLEGILEAGTNDLELSSELDNDCLSLVAAVVDVPAAQPSCRLSDTPQCNAYIEEAESISYRAWVEGETHFTRDEYLTLFEAAECKTGVPAEVLKAIAFSEGLGVYYEDPYPRQVIEPCDTAWNLNGFSYGESWERIYGYGQPAIAIGAPEMYVCEAASGTHAPQPGYVTYQMPGNGNMTSYAASCSDNPGADNTCLEVCPGDESCVEPGPPAGDAWTDIWPYVFPVATGDDASAGYSATYGLGIMQLTFTASDLVCPPSPDSGERRLNLVSECHAPSAEVCTEYLPLAGADPSLPYDMEPLVGLERVARDPWYNILQATQLMMVKYQQLYHDPFDPTQDELVMQADCGDEGLLMMAGPDAPTLDEPLATLLPTWAQAGGRYKTSPTCNENCADGTASDTCQNLGASCEECCVAEDIMGAAFADLAAIADSNCFCDSPYRPNKLVPSQIQCSTQLKAQFTQTEPGQPFVEKPPAQCTNGNSPPKTLDCPFE